MGGQHDGHGDMCCLGMQVGPRKADTSNYIIPVILRSRMDINSKIAMNLKNKAHILRFVSQPHYLLAYKNQIPSKEAKH